MTQLFLHTVAGLKTGNASINPYSAKSSDEGKVLFIGEDGNNIDLSADTIDSPFYITQVTGTDKPILKSNIIDPNDVQRVNLTLATAGAKQITVVGDSAGTANTADLPTDKSVTIKVIRTDLGYNPDETEVYNVAASAAPHTELVSLMANSKIVDVVGQNTGLALNGKTVDVSFETIITDGNDVQIENVKTVTQDPVRNVGNLDFLRNIQEYSQASYGFFNRVYLPLTPEDYVKDPTDLAIELNATGPVNADGFDIVTMQIKFGNHPSIGPKSTEIYLSYPASVASASDSTLAAGTVTEAKLKALFG